MGRKVVFVVNALSGIGCLLCCISMVLPWHKRLYLVAKVVTAFRMDTSLFFVHTHAEGTFFGWMMDIASGFANQKMQSEGDNLIDKFRDQVEGTQEVRGVADYYCATADSQIGFLMFGNACRAFNAANWCCVGTIIAMVFAFVASGVGNGFALYYTNKSPKATYRKIAQMVLFLPPLLAASWSGLWMYASMMLDHPYEGSLLDDTIAKTASSTSGISAGFIVAATSTVVYAAAALLCLKVKNKGESIRKDLKQQQEYAEAAGMTLNTGVPTPEEYGAAPSYGATDYNGYAGDAAAYPAQGGWFG